MFKVKRAKEQFDFYTILHLFQLTGRKAENLEQLLGGIKDLPGSVIYHHTHLYLQQHLYLSPEPPNDFAYWVTGMLQEPTLGEKLESIDTCQFNTIRSLREKIISTIKEYLKEQKGKSLREVPEGQEFHFIRTISFILSAGYQAWDLLEFIEILNKIIALDEKDVDIVCDGFRKIITDVPGKEAAKLEIKDILSRVNDSQVIKSIQTICSSYTFAKVMIAFLSAL